MNPNVKAFLDMIAFSEGTSNIGDRGYNVLVGSTVAHPLLFSSYADHPRHKMWCAAYGIYSTAAGRYQILARIYDAYKLMLHLPDFSPDSQDAIAIQMLSECHALAKIEAGQFDAAVEDCAHLWASLPGANYSQHENKISRLKGAYTNAGGVLT